MTAMNGFSKAVITGGAGFIGSHVAELLVANTVETIVFDDLSSGFSENTPPAATLIKGDVRDDEAVKDVGKGADVIFHFAEFIPNIVGHVIRFSSTNPKQDLEVSVGGTVNLLEEARRHDCHFVLASSAAVYGSSVSPLSETSETVPISAYGVSKLCAEKYSLFYHRKYGIPVTIVRFFNVFGPRQRKYLMYDCLSKMKNDPHQVELLGTGNEIRDYIFVREVIDQILQLIPNSKYEDDPIFNIGTGVGRKTSEVVELLAKLTGQEPKFRYLGKTWSGTSECLIAETKKTAKYYSGSQRKFEDGLRELVAWFSSQD